ncbi:MAG: GGDEF domain-containing protein [Negativicutes bacterium]|nr:GGDEF domain-containing protein [Negativicutes bacterium]
MNLDVRTLFVAMSVIVSINALILTLNWRYAKSMRAIIGWWSFNQVLIFIGTVLVAFRGITSDFLSIIIANICISGSYIAIQEGIARYVGKKGYLRILTLFVLFLQVVLCWLFTYEMPSVASRIIVFSIGTLLISLISILTLQKRDTAMDLPARYLIATLVFHACLMMIRTAAAIVQGGYADYLHSGSLQAWILVGIIASYTSFTVCFFWLIAHNLGMEVQKQAFTDSLTGIPNRRAMDEFLERLFFAKENCNIGILLIDVDEFKEINDKYGHHAGDMYLIALGRAITSDLRHGDIVFRYGGDEFVVVVRDVVQSSVLQMADRLQQRIEQLSIYWQEQQLSTTVSIGLTIDDGHARNWDDLMRKADEALYVAKNAGGNRVVSSLFNNKTS